MGVCIKGGGPGIFSIPLGGGPMSCGGIGGLPPVPGGGGGWNGIRGRGGIPPLGWSGGGPWPGGGCQMKRQKNLISYHYHS